MGWIFSGFIDIFFELSISVINFLFSAFSSFSLEMDVGYLSGESIRAAFNPFYYTNVSAENRTGLLDRVFPQSASFFPVFMWIALALVFIILIFSVMRSMFDSASKGEHPLRLAAGAVLAGTGVVYSYSIFIMAEKVLNTLYRPIRNVFLELSKEGFSGLEEDAGLHLFAEQDFLSSLAVTVISLIFFLAVIIQFTRLLLEAFERYIVMGLMFYTSPLAFSTLVSNETRIIFRSWIRMLISQFLLMALNLFFLGIFYSAFVNLFSQFSVYEEGTGYLFKSPADFMCRMCLLIGWLTAGQKIDQHLRSLGLSVAQTGEGLGAAIFAASHTAGRLMDRTAKAVRGAGRFAGGVRDKRLEGIKKDEADAAKFASASSLAQEHDLPVFSYGSYPTGMSDAEAINAYVERENGRITEAGACAAMQMPERPGGGETVFSDEDSKQVAEALSLSHEGRSRNVYSPGKGFTSSDVQRTVLSGHVISEYGPDGSLIRQMGLKRDFHAVDENGNATSAVFETKTKAGKVIEPVTKEHISHGTAELGKILRSDAALNERHGIVFGDIEEGSFEVKGTGRDGNKYSWTPLKENGSFTGAYVLRDEDGKALAQAGLDQVVRLDSSLGPVTNHPEGELFERSGFTYSVQELDGAGKEGFAAVYMPAVKELRKNSAQQSDFAYASESPSHMKELSRKERIKDQEDIYVRAGRWLNRNYGSENETPKDRKDLAGDHLSELRSFVRKEGQGFEE